MGNYSELLLNPQWQKKRLEILERDNFCCQSCFNSEETLDVHHRTYVNGKKPWEYSSGNFITLCRSCHQAETENIKQSCDLLIRAVKENFLSEEINQLACAIGARNFHHTPDVISSIIATFFDKSDFQKIIIEKYFKYISKRKNKKT